MTLAAKSAIVLRDEIIKHQTSAGATDIKLEKSCTEYTSKVTAEANKWWYQVVSNDAMYSQSKLTVCYNTQPSMSVSKQTLSDKIYEKTMYRVYKIMGHVMALVATLMAILVAKTSASG